jgi:glycosyltransferase involved in cell wall biosynthesis
MPLSRSTISSQSRECSLSATGDDRASIRVGLDTDGYDPPRDHSESHLNVAIDLRIADAPGMEMTGAGRYALETARALQRVRPSWQFFLFSNRPELLSRTRATIIGTRLPTKRAVARVAWLHTASALPTRRVRPDLWFSPSFVLPLWWHGPSVVTVHDLTFLLLRNRYRGRANARYATAATRWSARHADCVLCGAHATQQLLHAHWEVEPDKVEVIPYGVADVFFEASAAQADAGSGVPPYVLFVGTWEARKGIGTLYDALRRVNVDGQRVRLLLAGQAGWGTEHLLEPMRLDPSIEFRRTPDDGELASLYRGALALAYPSEMEGFGLPVAEAMACGCAVIATDLPAIREFAGDSPLYLSPGDSRHLATHIECLLSGDPNMQERLRRGRDAAASLRWDALGERTAAVMERVVRTRTMH